MNERDEFKRISITLNHRSFSLIDKTTRRECFTIFRQFVKVSPYERNVQYCEIYRQLCANKKDGIHGISIETYLLKIANRLNFSPRFDSLKSKELLCYIHARP